MTNPTHIINLDTGERTGVAKLDALIDEFRSQDVSRKHFCEWEWDPPVSEFAPGPRSLAMGACGSLTDAFNEFLAERGVTEARAYSMGDDDPSITWEDAGYQAEFDRAMSEAEGHTVSVVRAAGREYMIDWTAGQFGCTEFPLVQHRRKGQCQWIRKAA